MKKKVVSIILVLALCVSLAVPAFAADASGSPRTYVLGWSTEVVISNVTAESKISAANNLSITHYQIPSNATLTFNVEETDFDFIRMMEGDFPEGTVPVLFEGYGQSPRMEYVEHSKPIPAGNWLVEGNSDAYWIVTQGMGMPFAMTIVDAGSTAPTAEQPSASDAPAADAPVSDTPAVESPAADAPSSWAVEQIDAAVAANLIPEALQSNYAQVITRAEFAALAVALYETVTGGEITEHIAFSDTDDVNVGKAAAIGIVTGFDDGIFDPDAELTREQAAVMLARIAEVAGKPLAASAATFADNDAISPSAIEQVGQIQAAGIMGGIGGNTFAPQDPYTREQSITTIMRLYEFVTGA